MAKKSYQTSKYLIITPNEAINKECNLSQIQNHYILKCNSFRKYEEHTKLTEIFYNSLLLNRSQANYMINIYNENRSAKFERNFHIYISEITTSLSFCSYSLVTFISPTFLSKATIEIDYGYGKQKLSSYNVTCHFIPFVAKFYITYRNCESVYWKNVSVNHSYYQDEIYGLNMSDIPHTCYSYISQISVSSSFPDTANVYYQINNEPISDAYLRAGSKKIISRNFIYSLSLYVKYNYCNEFSILKTVTIDDHSTIYKINITSSDIPQICLIPN